MTIGPHTTVALVIFAKAPGIGKAKSRLAQECGAPRADEIYRELLSHTATLVDRRPYYLAYAGDGVPGDLISYFTHATDAVAQKGDTLGDRMAHALRWARAKGHSHACIIGCDCPSLDRTTLDDAFALSENYDVVIGPATDGGYYLIQTNPQCSDLFSIEGWGGSTVLEKTLGVIKERGWSYRLLGERSDIDTYNDYLAWKGPRK